MYIGYMLFYYVHCVHVGLLCILCTCWSTMYIVHMLVLIYSTLCTCRCMYIVYMLLLVCMFVILKCFIHLLFRRYEGPAAHYSSLCYWISSRFALSYSICK